MSEDWSFRPGLDSSYILQESSEVTEGTVFRIKSENDTIGGLGTQSYIIGERDTQRWTNRPPV